MAEAVPTVDTTALFNVELIVPEDSEEPAKFTTVPEVSIAVGIPDSNASGHPSPSESKSNRFGIPSPSVSKSLQKVPGFEYSPNSPICIPLAA